MFTGFCVSSTFIDLLAYDKTLGVYVGIYILQFTVIQAFLRIVWALSILLVTKTPWGRVMTSTYTCGLMKNTAQFLSLGTWKFLLHAKQYELCPFMTNTFSNALYFSFPSPSRFFQTIGSLDGGSSKDHEHRPIWGSLIEIYPVSRLICLLAKSV